MRQYEFAIRIAQIHHLVEERKFKKALAVVRTLDMKQVKNISDLTVIADVFARTEQYDSAKEAYLKIYNKSKTRRVVYRLASIAIRTKELGEAEKYFHEFVQMNPGTRDVIILRYRIDKTAGVHIGKLIETLEELKEEEYIEEWAYELAKLYYKAGRFEECRRECEDILLWFGHGEIVERAKKLIEYVDDKEAMPYLDDKDYTVDRNEPNPDDTGSLPDLHEYLSNMQEEENRRKHLKERKAKEQAEDNRNVKEAETAVTREQDKKEPESSSSGISNKNVPEQDGFIDDYEEDDFEIDAGFGKLAQKLTGFLHFGGKKDKKKDTEDTDKNSTEPFGGESYIVEDSGKADLDIKIRINKDLYNKTIAEAKNLEKENVEKEQQEKEENINETEEEPVNVKADITENKAVSDENIVESKKAPEPVYFQSGMGITQDLSREISAIYEAEHKEQLKEKAVKVVGTDSRRPLKRDATKVIERMTKAVKSDENKNLPVANADGTLVRPEEKTVVETVAEPEERAAEEKAGEETIASPEEKAMEGTMAEPEEKNAEEIIAEPEEIVERITEKTGDEIPENEEKPAMEQAVPEPEENMVQEEEDIQELSREPVMPVMPEFEDGSIVVSREEIELAEMEAKKAHEEALMKAEEAKAIVEEARRKAEEAAEMLAEIEKKHAMAEAAILPGNSQEKEEDIEKSVPENIQEETIINEDMPEAEVPEENIPERKTEEEPEYKEENYKEESLEEDDYEEDWLLEENGNDEEVLKENAQEEENLSDDDLPTTRALHTSFDDILTLIGGEPDPSHFVFVGNTFDLITGLSKRIVKVMKNTGYMSIGRIARISAKNLNKMNLAEFKNQLKGNCLLIDEAADLMIPTIASIFEIMDEYYGDFVVILADNGNTLDQLFKFAPALARRFKYIIDISGYTEEDCN